MTNEQARTYEIEDVEILGGGFRNFAGAERQYNQAGQRNFCAAISEEQARQLIDAGFNVRALDPRDPEDEPLHFLKIDINEIGSSRVPKQFWSHIYVRTNDEAGIEWEPKDYYKLDNADIIHADLIIGRYEWNVNGNTGVKAKLRDAYITIKPNRFEERFFEVPDSAMNTQTFAKIQAKLDIEE